ncbi:MAG: PilT/PilU family type 4a pilus ATPase [Patescibacteria group bacterium]|jgi:twitching motility protein PilT|nr:PilT/PilU family type 4a pilus ATPase [Patescibacteria group bacterium]MDD5172772.1 PilT/PilU family type 4a pilus ATPase [Patescibacteria group bacterium]
MGLEEIFSNATSLNASDVHLSSDLSVFFRINGLLQPIKNWPVLKHEDILKLIEPIINENQKEILFKEKTLEFSYQIKSGIRFRISVFWEKGKIALSARLISSLIPSMEEIKMPESIYKLINLKDGLVLVTGPTGCGKSTTLAALINYINTKRSCHIITLEDPIEYVFSSQKSIIAQRELGKDMNSFQSALKHIVRQDPDIILVSEMRDLETISLAVTLAETGHLIFATLHTPNAPQTIDRIIDIFPTDQQKQIRLQISMALKCIISQHLLPKINSGRVAAREVLFNTPAIANLIRENKISQIRSVLQTSSQDGMSTLEQDLKKLYHLGEIDLKTALNYANYPDEIIKE